MDETYHPVGTGVIEYRLKRQSLVNTDEVMEVSIWGSDQFHAVITNSSRSEEDDDVISNSFEGLWFDFPTPFRKGDIVWIPSNGNKINDCDGAFVLRGLSTWESSDSMKKSGDNSDMNGFGYFVNPNGTVYHEVVFNYMDLEYYPGPYKTNEKVLLALSKFVKNEIDLDLLLYAYRKILFDIASDDVILKSWYSEDIRNEMGLI